MTSHSSLCCRFTPTGVGTMREYVSYFRAWLVHPHGRGDNALVDNRPERILGSPPRAWGQSSARLRPASGDRFTPTGVGTIRSASRTANTCAVHPHGRGDNIEYLVNPNREYGSPPRAWGQYLHHRLVNVAPRFTPTGVGTITGRAASRYANTVHPHGRGDNLLALLIPCE